MSVRDFQLHSLSEQVQSTVILFQILFLSLTSAEEIKCEVAINENNCEKWNQLEESGHLIKLLVIKSFTLACFLKLSAKLLLDTLKGRF